MSQQKQAGIPEENVARILARAAELDRASTMQLDTIRTAAIEAGISVDAIDRALEEYAATARVAAVAQQPAEKLTFWQRLWRWPKKSTKIIVGVMVGIAFISAFEPVVLGTLFFVGMLLVLYRIISTLVRYLRDRFGAADEQGALPASRPS